MALGRRGSWCSSLLGLLGLLGLVLAGCGPAPERTAVDWEIYGGQLIDGTGAPPRPGTLWLKGGRIHAITEAGAAAFQAAQRFDAAGRVVAPGFIDPHSHGDPQETPAFENFLAMGVSTITLGQDGSSPEVAPLAPLLTELDALPLGPNLALFVGHGTLRTLAGVGRDPDPSPEAIARMQALLDDALDHTFGLSSGLEYNPGLWAPEAELLALAEVVGRRDRVIMSHLRSEDDDALFEAIDELLAQGRYARVHIAHLKSVYGRGAARGDAILDKLTAAQRSDLRVSADVYPYSASYTGLALLFPPWAKAPEQFVEAKATRRDELEAYLKARVLSRNGPEATLLGSAPYAGLTLAELAERLEKPFETVLVEDLGPQGGSAAYFIMDEDLQRRFIQDPRVSISSDGSPTGFHPRGHGTFAKIIEQYVREEGSLSLPEAVRQMTTLPAAQLGIKDRGQLAPGLAADVVVFDPAAVRARASYAEPHRLAEGFDALWVNGVQLRSGGAFTGAAGGRVLRPSP